MEGIIKANIKIMKINKIKIYDSKIVFGKDGMLGDDFVKRIMSYKEKLREVEETPLEEIINDFNKDMYPDIELSIWEHIAEKYEQLIQSQPSLDIVGKNEVFKKLLLESFGK
jgi:hypothetical protein